MSGFAGHAQRSTLNSFVYAEFLDRAVEVMGPAQQALLNVDSDLGNQPIQNIRTKFIKQ